MKRSCGPIFIFLLFMLFFLSNSCSFSWYYKHLIIDFWDSFDLLNVDLFLLYLHYGVGTGTKRKWRSSGCWKAKRWKIIWAATIKMKQTLSCKNYFPMKQPSIDFLMLQLFVIQLFLVYTCYEKGILLLMPSNFECQVPTAISFWILYPSLTGTCCWSNLLVQRNSRSCVPTLTKVRANLGFKNQLLRNSQL